MATGTTTQRGYGINHQTNRTNLLYNLAPGTECEICAQPMYADPQRNFDQAPLEADHEKGDKTRLANRLLHRTCNRQIANHWVKHGAGWYTKHGRGGVDDDDPLDWPDGRVLEIPPWPAGQG